MMNFDFKFDPPETGEVDIDEADPIKDVCDFHNSPAIIKVKKSYIVHSDYIYLCAWCETHFSERWGELFNDH